MEGKLIPGDTTCYTCLFGPLISHQQQDNVQQIMQQTRIHPHVFFRKIQLSFWVGALYIQSAIMEYTSTNIYIYIYI